MRSRVPFVTVKTILRVRRRVGVSVTGEGAVRRDGKEIGLFNRFANYGAIYASD